MIGQLVSQFALWLRYVGLILEYGGGNTAIAQMIFLREHVGLPISNLDFDCIEEAAKSCQ